MSLNQDKYTGCSEQRRSPSTGSCKVMAALGLCQWHYLEVAEQLTSTAKHKCS